MKTLKDLIWNYTIDDSSDESEMWERKAFAQELQKEAIEWVKDFISQLKTYYKIEIVGINDNVPRFRDSKDSIHTRVSDGICGGIHIFCKFFNITWDDLK